MSTQTDINRTYTIMEAAKLSGLPESTLRYYEAIGIIEPIKRDVSSKHRVYSEDDVNLILGIACLSATGMSIVDMRRYLGNRDRGEFGAGEQIELLEAQEARLADEVRNLKLRQKYLRTKVKYWKAILDKDERLADEIAQEATAIAKDIKNSKIHESTPSALSFQQSLGSSRKRNSNI